MLSKLYLAGFEVLGDREGFQDAYVSKIPAIRSLRSFYFHKPVTFFIGENGSGKSTLLEALAVCCGFNPEGGSKNFNFSTRDTHSDLCRFLRVVKGTSFPRDGYFLRAESFYNVASQVDELDLNLEGYGGKSLHGQSHGESFLALAMSRFRGNGLYLLDEPEAALSPARQLTLLCVIDRLVREKSQLVVCTHSPILTAYPQGEIYTLTEGGPVLTPYRETENYRLTRRFLENPDQMLRNLMNPPSLD